ncbi:uncharacterized protein P174DRAFT_434828 [Aspergillus novofumigatus IBT 16806]|uniref:Uncharacterized protein n=1 Tax=Aspergillus novofumigatus (strain IBT 16806) TaxID=1392255 RepID=A0A2I1BYM8_ASPN1|nr:uncharacterized protein P174DRAFT_434828 [Aspergillus novofumigatus IBT 16806]PKX90451.1 hypothetical protein P174DRAFT_434828 [Aspergillus novofumigatus IBT 16806]
MTLARESYAFAKTSNSELNALPQWTRTMNSVPYPHSYQLYNHLVRIDHEDGKCAQYIESIKYVSDTISSSNCPEEIVYKLISEPWMEAGEIGRCLDSSGIRLKTITITLWLRMMVTRDGLRDHILSPTTLRSKLEFPCLNPEPISTGSWARSTGRTYWRTTLQKWRNGELPGGTGSTTLLAPTAKQVIKVPWVPETTSTGPLHSFNGGWFCGMCKKAYQRTGRFPEALPVSDEEIQRRHCQCGDCDKVGYAVSYTQPNGAKMCNACHQHAKAWGLGGRSHISTSCLTAVPVMGQPSQAKTGSNAAGKMAGGSAPDATTSWRRAIANMTTQLRNRPGRSGYQRTGSALVLVAPERGKAHVGSHRKTAHTCAIRAISGPKTTREKAIGTLMAQNQQIGYASALVVRRKGAGVSWVKWPDGNHACRTCWEYRAKNPDN